jgi:predicted phosphate transport protein (TIGR00153 family)
MFSLMPKEKVFFDLFEKSAANVHQGALALKDLMDNYADVEAKVRRIKALEHAEDEVTCEILNRLARNFITPIDREDIQRAATRLDDVMDEMNTAANRMLLFKIAQPTEDARAFAQVLVKASELLRDAFGQLRNLKRKGQAILEICGEIRAEESEGDRLRQHALASLFDHEDSAKEIIKWKDIYQILEKATDRAEDVADVIHTIVVKNT